MRIFFSPRLVAALVALALWFASAPTARAAVSVDTLKAKIAEVEASSELEEEEQAKLVELYRKALSHLETAQASDDAAEAFRRAAEEAPAKTESARQKLEQDTLRPVRIGVADNAPTAEIEGALAKEEANGAAVKAKLTDLEEKLSKEAVRPDRIRDRLTEANRQQEETTVAINAPPPSDVSTEVAEAKRWLAECRAQALSAEIRKLDRELLSQPARLVLLKAQKELEALSVDRIVARGQLLRDLLVTRRRTESEQAMAEAEEAQREALGKHPILQQIAEENASLSAAIANRANDLEKVAAKEDAARAELKRVSEEFDRLRQKLDVGGLSQALGLVLYDQQRSIPKAGAFESEARAREKEIAVASLEQIGHAEERRTLRNPNDYADQRLVGISVEEAKPLRADLIELVESRRDLASRAVAVNQSYVRSLGELDFTQRQLAETSGEYRSFLAERLMWVRNASAPGFEELRTVAEDTRHVISPAGWLQVVETMFRGTLQLVFFALLLTVCGTLLWKRSALRSTLADTGQFVGRPTTDRFVATLQAFGLSALLATPGPLLTAGLAFQLRLTGDVPVFANAVAAGLLFLAQPLFYLSFFRVVCREKGLAAAHFDWPEPLRRLLRRELRRLMILFLPAAFVVVVMFNSEQFILTGGLERIVLMIAGASFVLFVYRIISPSHGVLSAFGGHRSEKERAISRTLWLALALALPVLIVVLAAGGYLYAAATLTRRLSQTVWFLLGLALAHQLALRSLALARVRLSYRAARERFEAARAAAQKPESGQSTELGDTPPVEEAAVDFASLSEDTRKLANAATGLAGIIGVWLIWESVLPALSILNETTLWYRTGVLAGERQMLPVTLADVGLALLIVGITIIAIKRFPALLEIAVLQRLEMSPGAHYTATTLSRYLIVAAGTVIVFGTLGFDWSQIQWLVAALSVGIGFGLQEIVANFISGLIILFERPIRVGDAVTVGDAEGIVTRIRIRATTIRTWDRKEVLVPNKEFVTGRLCNWSLSDDVTRLDMAVGVAYGSNVRKAMALITEAAEGHPRVLHDPKPSVIFDGFGDNALNLTLRFFVGALDDRLATLSELHQEINDRFNEAGVVIAFPQRDLHLDATRPLDIRIRSDAEPKASPREDE